MDFQGRNFFFKTFVKCVWDVFAMVKHNVWDVFHYFKAPYDHNMHIQRFFDVFFMENAFFGSEV